MLTPADHVLVLLIIVGLPLRALFGIRALRVKHIPEPKHPYLAFTA